MKTRLARRIFGLPPLADRSEVQRAHARLRAHIEQRPTDGTPRREELAQLDEAREVLVRFQTRLGVGLATLSVAVLLGFALWALWRIGVGWGEGSGVGAGEGARPGLAEAAAGPATLVASAGIDGARLIVANPDTGEVLLDAPADARVHALPPGSVRVRVQHPDCGPGWEQSVELEAGARHALAPTPCPDTGWLVVESDGPGDRLAIDGERVGSTSETAHALPIGRHEVRVEREAHEPWEGRVEIEPGKRLALRASPRPAEAQRPVARAPAAPKTPVRSPARDGGDQSGDQRFGSWHERARQWLLSLYDRDRSNALDTEDEVRSVPCRSWTGLADSYAQQGLALPLTRLYGFDGDAFVEGALGVSPRVRDIAYARMRECGLP